MKFFNCQHITPTLKKLHWLPIKQRIDYKLCLLTYNTLQINNLHIITIVFHLRHTLFLHDLLIHSFFPFHMSDHHLAKGLSLSLVHDFGIHYLLILEIQILYQFSVPAQNTPLQNCIPSLGSFPSPWTVYPDFDSCYSHFMPYRMTPSVRHRAIEVHYYYYYYYFAGDAWSWVWGIRIISYIDHQTRSLSQGWPTPRGLKLWI